MSSFFSVGARAVLGVTGAMLAGCGMGDEVGVGDELDLITSPAQPLEFSRACDDGERITLAAVGDVLLHDPLQKQAYADREGFLTLWAHVGDLLARADVTYANLEGPTAQGVNKKGKDVSDPGLRFDDDVYSGYPMFNYHPRLVTDLVRTGVDVVSTANNHSLDRGALGVDRTIEALEAGGLAFTGTRRSDSAERSWVTFTEQGGFKLAWIACTFSTNGLKDKKDQVLMCYEHTEEIEKLIEDLSARADVDAVVVTPHWGVEYEGTPRKKEQKLAQRFLDAGASVVLGSHPHVLQPWSKYVTKDGRETFVIYSLGNFVSGQNPVPRRTTLLLYVGLTRGKDGKTFVNGARYIPMAMKNGDEREVVAIDRSGYGATIRKAVVSMFGEWNMSEPDRPLSTTPECGAESN